MDQKRHDMNGNGQISWDITGWYWMEMMRNDRQLCARPLRKYETFVMMCSDRLHSIKQYKCDPFSNSFLTLYEIQVKRRTFDGYATCRCAGPFKMQVNCRAFGGAVSSQTSSTWATCRGASC